MTRQEAIRILDPATTGEALAEIEYYAGFSGATAKAQAVTDACEVAVFTLQEQGEVQKFTPGMPVWTIERDEDGNASDVSGYVFLAQCEEVVILSSYINDYDFEDILAYHVQCTAEDYDTHLCVFPAEDCYSSKEECEAAFEAEQEGASS